MASRVGRRQWGVGSRFTVKRQVDDRSYLRYADIRREWCRCLRATRSSGYPWRQRLWLWRLFLLSISGLLTIQTRGRRCVLGDGMDKIEKRRAQCTQFMNELYGLANGIHSHPVGTAQVAQKLGFDFWNDEEDWEEVVVIARYLEGEGLISTPPAAHLGHGPRRHCQSRINVRWSIGR
jgi:hypothetical protein